MKNLFEQLSPGNQAKMLKSDSISIKQLIESLKKYNFPIQPTILEACDVFWFFHPMRVFDLTVWNNLFRNY